MKNNNKPIKKTWEKPQLQKLRFNQTLEGFVNVNEAGYPGVGSTS